MLQDELKGLFLGHSAHGWCGMQQFQQITQSLTCCQRKVHIGFQMRQCSGTYRIRTVLFGTDSLSGQLRQNIFGHIILLRTVLVIPLLRQLALLQTLCSGQCHRVISSLPAREKNLGGAAQPETGFGGIEQIHIRELKTATGRPESAQHGKSFLPPDTGTTRKDQFSAFAFTEFLQKRCKASRIRLR